MAKTKFKVKNNPKTNKPYIGVAHVRKVVKKFRKINLETATQEQLEVLFKIGFELVEEVK